jgi:hypothetical protein
MALFAFRTPPKRWKDHNRRTIRQSASFSLPGE